MLAYIIAAYLLLQTGNGFGAPSWLSLPGGKDTNAALAAMPCGIDMPRRANMAESASPQLRKLAEYEAVCKAAFADQQMLFSATPTTPQEARQLGNRLATTLKEYDAYSVHPLVVLEPVAPDGTILSLAAFAAGAYDASLAEYFATLQKRDVSDAMMGTWVPFPEANTPVWNETNPDDFATAVTRIARLQKKAFPGSQASVLLGSQSYPSNDTEWLHGRFASLLPYTQNIPAGLIDSFGYQGFPWLPAADTEGYAMIDANKFLRTDYAAAAAESLGVRAIWFNTGTFARAHTDSPAAEVTMQVDQRRQILHSVLTQAGKLEERGFEVTVNLFAEDKSAMTEGVDWSYWQNGKAQQSAARPAFVSFVKQATADDIPVAVYDDDHRGNGMISGYRSQQR
jgi:hypothetical protein